MAARELEELGRRLGWTHEADQLRAPGVRQHEGPGNVLLATLEYAQVTEVFCQFGERGVSSEVVARRLADEVLAFQRSTAATGPHLADQWMLPLALAVWRTGRAASYTASELTDHTRTNAAVINACLPVRVATEAMDGASLVRIEPLPVP